MIRTKLLLGSYILCLLAACGGNGSSPQNTDHDAGHNPNQHMDGSVMDASTSDASNNSDGGGSTLPPPKDAGRCLKACADNDCGKVPNGCGEFLECGGCETGEICGATSPNKCGLPETTECEPKSATEVCSGKCGAVSDGCSDVIYCTSDNGGTSCESTQLCVDSACTDPTPTCTPATCEQKHHECGVDGNGCGGSLTCGDCGQDEQCDYASEGNTCVPKVVVVCTPITDTVACADTCGTVGDGCGGKINCEMNDATKCPDGTTCGGGGNAGECGTGQTCTKTPVATACSGKCGLQSDGCGDTYDCNSTNGGQTCDADGGESCGGGGVANQCGKVACKPKTQNEACPGSAQGMSCGAQPDGCGNLIDCGTCAEDARCGLTTPSICGQLPVCQPTPASTVCAGKCGSLPDGCGGVYQCSSGNGGVTCTGTEYCGANKQANKCGIPPVSCVPKSCAELGHTCGLASDGCGHVLNCWTECAGNTSCTGSCGNASACLADSGSGAQTCVSGSPTCTGSLCAAVPNNCANSPTTLTGTVRTPGRANGNTFQDQLPVPNALVYIPAEPTVALPSIFEGVQSNNTASCGRCNDEKLVADGQSLLAAAVTDFKGEFVLQGRIPVATAFQLVIKVGKWRRVVQVPAGVSAACASRALSLDYTRLAAHKTDGLTGTHLPKIAVSTGDVDAMECVLRGIGINDNEFTVPSGTGRIHMYRANGTKMVGTTCTGTYRQFLSNISCANNNNYGCVNGRSGCAWNDMSVADTTLYASQSAINAYDMVVFDCEGNGHSIRSADPRSRVLTYANNGGRVFASHWSYEWLDNNGTLDQASAWTNTGSAATAVGYVSLPTGATARTQANAVKSLVYRDWLDWQGALTGTSAGVLDRPTTPQMNITDPRDVAGATVGTSTDEWMYRNSSGAKVQQLSFNTPYAAAANAICGRVAFSAFHVAASSSGTTLSTSALAFPAECHTGALTAQEKTLAFMLFDLGACVSAGDPPQPPACEPKTIAAVCPNVNDACGFVSDGCGGVVDCAGCSPGNYCDGNLCRPQQCTPANCASLGYNCGNWPDGCGGTARNSQGLEGCGECTGGQVCGLNTPGICGGCVKIPLGTACPSNSCGIVSDGCGSTYNCGVCATGYCGGAGPNQCGQNNCTPLEQSAACNMKNCGLVADGCGGTLNCGMCTQPDTCGGGGAPNVCGHPTCTPKTLQDACNGLSCGWVSDGCGGAHNCGACANGGVCGGGGPNKCGGTCMPTSCSAAGAECGNIGDRCGGLINCGPCPSGQTCGAAGPNKCGSGPSCSARSCNAAGADCGLIGDGCGAAIDCGACNTPQTCGGAGTPNMCGTGTQGCNKQTCNAQSVQCGAASDGCGGLLDCGGCPSGFYCANGMCNPALL
ncbi:MAG TPA: hypothetical protein VFN67_42190 [Polyangiales bacterium]|nr:hypothetical protein [Polyangiales bacterium]